MGTLEDAKHKVNLSKYRNFRVTFREKLKETFFPDDPFRHFRGLPPHRKAFAFLKYFAPILEWGPKYKFTEFKFDLLAGITIASMAIPQGISYARLAGLPPIIGLCMFFFHFHSLFSCSYIYIPFQYYQWFMEFGKGV